MTIASEITKLNTNLTNSYTACNNKGATMPANQNFDNLATCIGSIQTGGGSTLITKTITANGTYNASSDNADGYSSVTVNVPNPSTGTLSITQNGTYDVTNYASANVSVSGGTTTNKFNIEYDVLSYPYFPSPIIDPVDKVVKSSRITKEDYFSIRMGAYSMENDYGDVYDEGYQQCYLCFDENDMLFQVIPVMYSSTTNDITLGFLATYGTLDDEKPMLIKFLGVSGSNISYSSHNAKINFEMNGDYVNDMDITW